MNLPTSSWFLSGRPSHTLSQNLPERGGMNHFQLQVFCCVRNIGIDQTNIQVTTI